VFRADSGFCRDLLLTWCDRNEVKYVVGLARNERLLALAGALMRKAERQFKKTEQKAAALYGVRLRGRYWQRLRWVIAKAEHTDKGSNPRFIVTNVVGDSQRIYDRRYCQRGEMENRVKEQMMLFADRVSAHRWWANQWRLLLSALAYTLMEALRRLALGGTALAQATCATNPREADQKLAPVVVAKLTVLRLHLSSPPHARSVSSRSRRVGPP